MSYEFPTGMNTATAIHYRIVAANMDNHLRRNAAPQQASGMNNFATNALQMGAQRLGVDPVIFNSPNAFAKRFVNNLFH